MSAKKLLSRADLSVTLIQTKMEQAENIRLLVEKCTQNLGGDKVSGTQDPHRRENLLCSLIDLENEIKESTAEITDSYKEVMNAIALVKDRELRTVLEMKHLNGKTWKKTADTIHVSNRQVFRIYDRAISVLDNILKQIPQS